jgi:hypothetical protein
MVVLAPPKSGATAVAEETSSGACGRANVQPVRPVLVTQSRPADPSPPLDMAMAEGPDRRRRVGIVIANEELAAGPEG